MKYLLLLLASCTAPIVGDVTPVVVSKPTVKVVNREKVLAIVAASSCKSTNWKERGHAPAGYIKGMALLYARHVCTPNETTKHFGGPRVNSIQDVLNIYHKESMRDLFTLALSAGMYESSGKYTCGRDRSANFTSEDGAEAGIFQTSYNASSADAYMRTMAPYKDDCLLDVFKEGVAPSSPANAENWGKPDTAGYKYQQLSKSCPAYHAEFSLIAMRKLNRHFGPSRSGKLEFKSECAAMLEQIESTCL
jgi:hypothetical protein